MLEIIQRLRGKKPREVKAYCTRCGLLYTSTEQINAELCALIHIVENVIDEAHAGAYVYLDPSSSSLDQFQCTSSLKEKPISDKDESEGSIPSLCTKLEARKHRRVGVNAQN